MLLFQLLIPTISVKNLKSKSHPAILPDTTYLAFFVLFSVLPECLPEANSD